MTDTKKLPAEWEMKKLGDVCTIVSGNTPKGLENISNTGVYPFYKVSDMNILGNETKMIRSNLTLTKDEIKTLKIKIYPEGTTIFPKRGGAILTNKKRLLASDASFDLNIMGVLPNDRLISKYIFLWFQKLDLSKIYDGSNVPQINNKNIAPLDIPVPPLEIQQQIISNIEQLFSDLDKGIAELKLAQEQLRVYRQSVLKYAFEGKLNNDNIKDGELPEGWKIVKIKEAATINPKLPNKEVISIDLEVQFLPMKLVEAIVNKIDLVETRVFGELQKGSYTSFIDGDILFAKVTPCMENGKIAIVENLRNGIGYGSSEFHVIRCSDSVINRYMFYYLVQDRYRKEAENVMTGAVGLRRVPKQFIEEYNIPLPSKIEQKIIVQEIENRLSVANKMEESIVESLLTAEALRQSILKKAFNGELVNEIKTIEIPKVKNEYFHQLQLVALVINGFKKKKIDHGEMTLAKNLYLLDSIYKIPTGFKYDRWHLGPYPPALKKVVNNKEYFKRNENFIETTNDEKLMKYANPSQDDINKAITDLSSIFSKYKGAERSHKTELLATVCKVIEDIKSTDLAAVRRSMKEWKIELTTSKFKNKAEKFNETETEKCIGFIVERSWDRKLI